MKTDFADAYDEFEQRHWWFRARREILRSLLDRGVQWTRGMRILEVGVGPGQNLYSLYPQDLDIQGLDPDPINSERARHRGKWPVYTGTVEAMPEPLSSASFDVIALFDVLEHIEHDGEALDRLRARLKPGGCLALAVPAFMWMWGRQDVSSMHYRRYTLRGLRRLVEQHGFTVQRATYFNSLLFPLVACQRLLARLRPSDPGCAQSDFAFGPPWLDEALFRIFRAEEPLLRWANLPIGVSAFILAKPT